MDQEVGTVTCLDQVPAGAGVAGEHHAATGVVEALPDADDQLARDEELWAVRSGDVGEAADVSLIANGKRLAQVGAALTKATSARLMVDAGAAWLLVDSEAGSWCVKLIEGQFPDFNRIIPTPDRVTSVVTVDRSDLIRASRLVRGVAEENSRIVRLTAADGSLTLRASDSQSDQEATAVIDAEMIGDRQAVAFNGRYLSDAVERFESDRVTLELVKADAPGIVRPSGERNGHLCVVMPMAVAR